MVNKNDLNKFNGKNNISNLNKFGTRMNNELKSLAPIIAIEELSELIQATTKWMRFDRPGTNNKIERIKEDKTHLTEEIADATIALHIIKDMANIKQKDIDKMIAYKLDRKEKFLNNGTIVNRTSNNNHKKR